jgi:hypothetical protein
MFGGVDATADLALGGIEELLSLLHRFVDSGGAAAIELGELLLEPLA